MKQRVPEDGRAGAGAPAAGLRFESSLQSPALCGFVRVCFVLGLYWDRQGLERRVGACAWPPLSQERLGRLNDTMLIDSQHRPTVVGRTGEGR
jgi:hypothetical protein